MESFGDSAPYKTDQQFDGDKLRLKSVLKSFDSQSNQWTVEKVTYYIHSTVLGGAIVSELNEQGGKECSYVHWNGAVLAVQNVVGSNQSVQWKHFDASTATYRATNSSGQIVGSAEMDTVGANAGLFNSNPWPIPKSSGELQPYFSAGDMNSTADCYVGGVPMPCVLMESMARGNAIQSVETYGFSMRSGHEVWVEKDTIDRTKDKEGHVITYSGAGGEYVWVDDPDTVIESWVQTKNSRRVPLQTTGELREAFKKLLENPECKTFVDKLITEAEGHVDKSLRLGLGFEDLFENIGGQGEYVLVDGLNLDGYAVGGLTDRSTTSIVQGNAQVMIRTRSYFTTDRPKVQARSFASQRRMYLAAAFHETFHHIGRTSSAYSDESLGRAAFALTKDTQLLPNDNDHDPLNWSSYWDNQLMKHCMPDLVRAGNVPK